ncbi:MAG: TraR/DksA family transcriptional regulator [Spirochaetaceae bacterium]|nr:TraR/DksA family transcriptional regulator [Spirochaetaceae bacterium]
MELFYEQIKKILLTQREETLNALRAEDQEFTEAINSKDTSDPGDVASGDVDMQMIDLRRGQSSLALAKIEAALARLENGNYGICAKCGTMVDKERLLAVPEAALCINCQAKAERGRLN